MKNLGEKVKATFPLSADIITVFFVILMLKRKRQVISLHASQTQENLTKYHDMRNFVHCFACSIVPWFRIASI